MEETSALSCPYCGMAPCEINEHGWACGTFYPWEDAAPLQSTACQEIARCHEWIQVLEEKLAEYAGPGVYQKVKALMEGREEHKA